MKEKNTHISQKKKIDSRIFAQNEEPDFSFVDLTPSLNSTKNPTGATLDQKNLTELNTILPHLKERLTHLETHFRWIFKCLQQVVRDQNERNQQLLKKIQNVKQNNQQTEALIERHHQIMQSFQQKINLLQGIIQQQKVQLINTQSALHEAHRHLEKFKA